MKVQALGAAAMALVVAGVVAGCDGRTVRLTTADAPHVIAASDIETGRYLVKVGGCNDCHTPGYVQSGGKTPEADWLKGGDIGYRGPWGTTYAHNLRLTTAGMDEEAWVKMLGTREALPIMPWPSVRALDEADKRAIYRYIRSLKGDPGKVAPVALPPGVEPTTPYEDLNIKMPAGVPRAG